MRCMKSWPKGKSLGRNRPSLHPDIVFVDQCSVDKQWAERPILPNSKQLISNSVHNSKKVEPARN